jgi:outer membrane protein assembly factor BamB
MMRVYIFAIIAMMAISGSLVDGQNESYIKLELLYEKPFADLYSISEGFPPAEIQQILKRDDIPREDKEWLLNSLRLEIARREKILYTKDGDVVQLPLELKSIKTSDNLKYMIVYAMHYDCMGYSREDASRIRGEINKATLRTIEWSAKKELFPDSFNYWVIKADSLRAIYRTIQYNTKELKRVIVMEAETGRVLWQKEGEIYSLTGKGENIVPPSFISDDGKTSIAVPGLGPANQFYRSIYYYDENGNERKTVTGLYGESKCHDLSSDGEMFCTLIQIKRNDTKVGAVAVYDKDGNELWITEIPGYSPPAPPCIAISPNHNYITASIWGTNLLNDNGDIINTYECRTYKPGFSADEKYVMLGYPRDTIYFVQTDNGNVLWKKSLGGQPYSKPFVAKDGRVIFYTDGYLLSKNGDIIWQDKNAVQSTIGISPSGYLFIPSSEPELIIYRISSEIQNESQ